MDNKSNDLQGKYIGTAKVGPKGQIVIPKDARDMFNIKPGDTLLILADIDQGIAILNDNLHLQFAKAVFKAYERPIEPEDE
jgi:AbrB family looped-hinge helix DNA binding protein